MMTMQLDLLSFNPLMPPMAPLKFDFDMENVYQPPPPSEPKEPAYRIKFSPGMVTHEATVNEWQNLPHEIKHGRLILTFSEPVTLQCNSRKRSTKAVHTYRLFTDKDSGKLCNSLNGRTGFIMSDSVISRLISIEPEPTKDRLVMVRKLASRIHPNAWDDLKTRLTSGSASDLKYYEPTLTSITGKFDDYVMQSIRRAFEEKSYFTHDTGGLYRKKKTGRDLKVECKLCNDGIFRAWFYSEFPGCANGDYWLLLNPTTAAFKERD